MHIISAAYFPGLAPSGGAFPIFFFSWKVHFSVKIVWPQVGGTIKTNESYRTKPMNVCISWILFRTLATYIIISFCPLCLESCQRTTDVDHLYSEYDE